MNRTLKSLLIALSITVFAISLSFATSVVSSRGKAFKKSSSGQLIPLKSGMTVSTSDVIQTNRNAEVTLKLDNGCTVKILESSTVEMSDLLDKSQSLGVRSGNLLVQVTRLGGQNQLNITTPTSVAGVRGTEFSVAVQNDNASNIVVNHGMVEVYNPNISKENTVTLRDQQSISLTSADFINRDLVKVLHTYNLPASLEELAGKSLYFSQMGVNAKGMIEYSYMLLTNPEEANSYFQIKLNANSNIDKILVWENNKVIKSYVYKYNGPSPAVIEAFDKNNVQTEKWEFTILGRLSKISSLNAEGKVTSEINYIYDEFMKLLRVDFKELL